MHCAHNALSLVDLFCKTEQNENDLFSKAIFKKIKLPFSLFHNVESKGKERKTDRETDGEISLDGKQGGRFYQVLHLKGPVVERILSFSSVKEFMGPRTEGITMCFPRKYLTSGLVVANIYNFLTNA